MCKHLPRAALVQDYKQRHSQGELNHVTRTFFQTRPSHPCLGKWFKIATHTNALWPLATSVQILARGLKFSRNKVILFPFPLLRPLRAQPCELKNPPWGGGLAGKDTCHTNPSLIPETHVVPDRTRRLPSDAHMCAMALTNRQTNVSACRTKN